MNRLALTLAVFTPLFLGAAAVKTATFEERVARFRKQAHDDRQKQKIDLKTATAKYPTPELTLVTGALGADVPGGVFAGGGFGGFDAQATPAPLPVPAAVPSVLPGAVVSVHALGKLDKAALVLFDCDELEVISMAHTSTRVEARVKVNAPLFAEPKTCQLHAYQPLSTASVAIPALRISARWAWKLTLVSGEKIEWETAETVPEGGVMSSWSEEPRPGDGQQGGAWSREPRQQLLQLPKGRPQVGMNHFFAAVDLRKLREQYDAREPGETEKAQLRTDISLCYRNARCANPFKKGEDNKIEEIVFDVRKSPCTPEDPAYRQNFQRCMSGAVAKAVAKSAAGHDAKMDSSACDVLNLEVAEDGTVSGEFASFIPGGCKRGVLEGKVTAVAP